MKKENNQQSKDNTTTSKTKVDDCTESPIGASNNTNQTNIKTNKPFHGKNNNTDNEEDIYQYGFTEEMEDMECKYKKTDQSVKDQIIFIMSLG